MTGLVDARRVSFGRKVWLGRPGGGGSGVPSGPAGRRRAA
jgi:hypothetical protein